jgi:hypothetical protein
MFASSTGTPYGGYALNNAPNDSAGSGVQSLAGTGPPGMSGGFTPSVYNRSQDLVTNDTPSVLVTPTRLQRLCCSDNAFVVSDLVFAAISRYAPAGINYNDPRNRGSQSYVTTAMTIQMVNSELRQFARVASIDGANNTNWFADPDIVARWITPIGAVLNVQKVNGITRSINVCVSRRALVRHTFTSHLNSKVGAMHCQSMDSVAIMYSVVKCALQEQHQEVDVVQLFTVVMPNFQDNPLYDTKSQLHIDASSADRIAVQSSTDNRPNQLQSVYRSLGRVLHSPPRCPNVAECELACISREAYYNLGCMEVQLGCP